MLSIHNESISQNKKLPVSLSQKTQHRHSGRCEEARGNEVNKRKYFCCLVFIYTDNKTRKVHILQSKITTVNKIKRNRRKKRIDQGFNEGNQPEKG